MDLINTKWTWAKAQLQKPQTTFLIGMVGGLLIGVGADNMLLGIGLAIALGVPGYVSGKKKKQDRDGDTER